MPDIEQKYFETVKGIKEVTNTAENKYHELKGYLQAVENDDIKSRKLAMLSSLRVENIQYHAKMSKFLEDLKELNLAIDQEFEKRNKKKRK